MSDVFVVLPDGTYGTYNRNDIVMIDVASVSDDTFDRLTADDLTDSERYHAAIEVEFALTNGRNI